MYARQELHQLSQASVYRLKKQNNKKKTKNKWKTRGTKLLNLHNNIQEVAELKFPFSSLDPIAFSPKCSVPTLQRAGHMLEGFGTLASWQDTGPHISWEPNLRRCLCYRTCLLGLLPQQGERTLGRPLTHTEQTRCNPKIRAKSLLHWLAWKQLWLKAATSCWPAKWKA